MLSVIRVFKPWLFSLIFFSLNFLNHAKINDVFYPTNKVANLNFGFKAKNIYGNFNNRNHYIKKNL